MNWFLAHLILAFLWAALLGSYDLASVVSGFFVGFILFAITLRKPTSTYRKRFIAVLRFAVFYVKEILTSNLRIASDVIKARPAIKPGIVAVCIEPLSQRSAVVVANLITMTPGTLSLDFSEDGKFLYVHCLYLEDPESTRIAMERDYVGAMTSFQEKL